MEISKESQKKIREKLDSFKIKDTTNSHAIETFEKVILKKTLIFFLVFMAASHRNF